MRRHRATKSRPKEQARHEPDARDYELKRRQVHSAARLRAVYFAREPVDNCAEEQYDEGSDDDGGREDESKDCRAHQPVRRGRHRVNDRRAGELVPPARPRSIARVFASTP